MPPIAHPMAAQEVCQMRSTPSSNCPPDQGMKVILPALDAATALPCWWMSTVEECLIAGGRKTWFGASA